MARFGLFRRKQRSHTADAPGRTKVDRKAPSRPNHTARFIGADAAWRKVRIRLDDVQALHGGCNIFVRGSGEVVTQRIEPARGGMRERRVEFTLDPDDREALRQLMITTDILACTVPDRPGVPDEARPRLVVANARGSIRQIEKWANDDCACFDPVYHALTALLDRAATLPAVFEGRWDRNYAPPGFIDLGS